MILYRSAAPSFSEEARINAKKNRHTSLICCYYCFQIVEEQEKFEGLCFNINSLLGINAKPVNSNELQNENNDSYEPNKISPNKSSNSKKNKNDDFEYNAKIMSQRIKEILNWSNLKHKKKDTDYLKTDIKFFDNDLMLNKEKSAKITLSNITVSENISETEGGFALGTWKAQNFKRGTNHIRMIIMAHYMTDFDLPNNHPLQGTLGCIGYSLGATIQAMCFSTKMDEELTADQVVWIKQARVHYFCADLNDAKSFFSNRYIDFHFYCLYPDNSHSHTSSSSRSNEKEPQPHPQLVSNFRVSLNRLNWSSNGSRDGTEKIEFDIPIRIKGALKEAKLRLSVAIKTDELLPDLDKVMRFVKEEEIFWPTDDYYPTIPLPDTWLAMLTTNQSFKSNDNEEFIDNIKDQEVSIAVNDNEENIKDDTIFDEQENDAKAIKEVMSLIENEFNHDVNENEDDLTNDTAFTKQLNVNKILDRIKLKTKRQRIKELASPAFLNIIVEEAQRDEDEDEDNGDDDGFENLKEYISLYPFVDRILQVLREENIKMDLSDIPSKQSLIEAIRILSMSIEQILHQEDLPSFVNWKFFKELLEECIPWAKVQRTRVKLALENKDNANAENKAFNTNTKAVVSIGSGKFENHRKEMDLLIYDLHKSYPTTSLDVSSCLNEDFESRKYRRMTLALNIFAMASNYDDKVDIKVLHKFLETQRKRLAKIITLFNDGAMLIPPIPKIVSDELSIVHILYSTLLLCASSTLTSLLDTYHEEGVTVISRIGFLSIVEETFVAVTKNNYTPDETLFGFLQIATFQIITRQTERRATRVVSKLNTDVRRSSIITNSPLLSPSSSFSMNTSFSINKETTPFLYLCCDFHGNENFFLADIYCSECGKDDKLEFEGRN